MVGGARKGAGRKAGGKNRSTLEREALAKAMQAHISKHMPRMLRSQIEAACGVAHLFLRAEDGTFSRVAEKMSAEDMQTLLNGDANRYFIALKDPNTSAFNVLAAYGAGKPTEVQEVTHDGELTIRWQE